MQKVFYVYKKYPDSKMSYKFHIRYFEGNLNLSFEQSQVELMVKMEGLSLADNVKRYMSSGFHSKETV